MKSIVSLISPIVLVGSMVLFHSPAAGEEETSAPQLRMFKSSQGGFRVTVPEAWHVKEMPQEELYQVFLSREKVDQQGDIYAYGLSVLRLRDYRKAFQLEATTSDSVALEYATRVAAQLAGGQGGTVIGLPTGEHGSKLSRYMLLGGEGDECVSGQLLIGVKGKKWFHALWEAPCSEAKDEQMNNEITAMIKSLWVEKKWGTEAN